MKVSAKHQLYQPYWEAPTYIQGSPTNGTFSLTHNCSSPRNLMVPSADDGSSIAYTSIPIPVQQPSQSSKKMARSKATSSSIISPAQAELSMITFVDRPPLNATNFNVPPGQSMSFPGQILDASNQVRRQGHSQQSAQMKVAGPPLCRSPYPSSRPSLWFLHNSGSNSNNLWHLSITIFSSFLTKNKHTK